MEATSTGPPRLHPTPPQPPTDQQLTQKLVQFNLTPTPKTLHALCKKHLRKTLRKSNQNCPITPPSNEEVELSQFRALKTEYRIFTRAIDESKSKPKDGVVLMVGNPWERAEAGDELREVASREDSGMRNWAPRKRGEELIRFLLDKFVLPPVLLACEHHLYDGFEFWFK